MKGTTITVFKSIYKANEVPFHCDLEKVVERARQGKSKEIVEKIREAHKAGRDYSELKKQLPAIIFQGTFTQRNMNSCVASSGLMIHDYDKIPEEEYQTIFDAICDNPHTVVAMRSPSGVGIKAVIHIPQTSKDDYKKYFDQFNEDFAIPYFDTQTSDFARACFETYDPDIYINYQAEVYSPPLIDRGYESIERPPVLALRDDEDIIERIMKFNWKKSKADGRNNFVFDLAGAMCEYGVNQGSAESYLITHYQEPGGKHPFTATEIRTTVGSAYSMRRFASKYFEDYHRIDMVQRDISKPKTVVMEKYGLTEEQYDHFNSMGDDDKFWEVRQGRGRVTVEINPMQLKWFLERAGFRKYYPNGTKKATFLKIDSYMVEESGVDQIKDYTLSYLMEQNQSLVWNYMAAAQKIFTESYMGMLTSIDLKILRDTSDRCLIAFKNGILEIKKDSVTLGDPIDIDCYVWKSQVVPYEFKVVKDCSNDYSEFIKRISGNNPQPLMAVIGYLCSTHKNKINNKAIILNDEVISDNPEGGTGKGLLIQGIRQVRSVAILDGKTFDDNKSFAYQTVSTDTNVLVFDDVKRNFDFESKFSLVTEGLTLERKNKDAIKLTVEESPKIVISTNYAIKGEGNSHERRRHEVEIAQHYNQTNTPFSEFGRNLFDDWNEDDYVRFYNYIVKCIQLYLEYGLVEQNAKNLKLRKLHAETAPEFFEWIADSENVERNKTRNKADAYNDFVREYPDFQRWLTRKRFVIWVKKYCSYASLKYEDGNTAGLRWFRIVDQNIGEPAELIDF